MTVADSREPLEDVLGLPVHSDAALRLLQLIDEPDSDARDLARVMDTDPALTTRAIYLANSPFYGLAHPVATPARALTVLGLNTVRAIAASAAFGLLEQESAMPPQFWEHALETATEIARRCAGSGLPAGEAFCLGLVHDIGTALLYRRDPDAWWQATGGQDGALEAEADLLGEDHAALGARALRAARFPERLVDAVAAHHEPDGCAIAGLLAAAEDAAAQDLAEALVNGIEASLEG